MWVMLFNARRARFRRMFRRGVSIVYVGVAMITLFGLASLAVDLGRVRTCHEQLQNAADAATLAAVNELPTVDFGTITQTAIDVAGENPALETMADVRSADVEYGIWNRANRSFTVVSGNQRNAANAIRVTAQRIAARSNAAPLFLARIVGVSSSDIRTIATAFIGGGQRGFGIVGINSISMNGTTLTDSYNGASGPYDPGHPDHDGTIASNGNISLVGTVDVWGDARPGIDHVVTDPTLVHGWAGSLDAPLVYPPATVPSGTPNGTPNPINLNGNKTQIISPGSWVFSSISTKGNSTLKFTGKTTVYVTGDISITGGVVFGSTLPSDVNIVKIGSGNVDLGGGSAWYAEVYAPQADVKFHGTNSGGFYGSIVGLTLTIDGNSKIHYDESINPAEEPLRGVLVQ